ncbi:MAG: CopG family ribbon-helix-helix protein [Halobacteria archaeon]|nr:CopG family ribbon-helix-helix protein [Halobacteria archaeon]
MAVISVSVPQELLNRIDKFTERHGYSGRSELIRDASRSLIGEFEDKKLEDRELVGTVTVIFEDTGVEKQMIDLRHKYEDIVKSNVHSHIGDNYCMELFILEGSLDEIQNFVGNVRSTRDVLSINYSVNPIDDLA